MKNVKSGEFDFNNPELVSVIDEVPIWSAPFGMKLLDIIRYRKNITALDIGFGLGFPLLEIAMRLGNSCKVYGIDPWKQAIERTKKKIEIYEISNVEILDGSAEKIDLPDNSVDLIVSNNGINNVTDLETVLCECSRIMKKGSQFIATVNTNKTMHEFYRVYEEVLLEAGMDDAVVRMYDQIYQKRKPVEELKEMFQISGLKINRIIEDEFRYRYADGSAMLNHFFIRLAFLESWKSVIDRQCADEVFCEIENRINSISNVNGGFEMTVPFLTFDCVKV